MDYGQIVSDNLEKYTANWAHFPDGAVGCVVTAVDDEEGDLVGWSICSPKDAPDFDAMRGLAIAILRAEADKGFDTMFRNIPSIYYKAMILRIFGVEDN